MKLYATIVTILLTLVVGFQTLVYIVEKRDRPKEIANFSNHEGQPNSYSLSYSKNGDLTFSPVKLDSNRPSITHWDYYGSIEIQNYGWVNENTISIETKDSIIKIVIPVFKIISKE